MTKVTYKGTTLADSSDTVVVEGNQYFPPDSLDKKYFTASPTKYHCPWKGDCDYYTGEIDGETVKDIAWYYPEPYEKAANIKGRVAFDKRYVKFE